MRKNAKAVLLVAVALLLSCLVITEYARGETQDNPDFVVEGNVLVKYNGPGGRVVVPNDLGITVIGKNAFERGGFGQYVAEDMRITSIVIPDGVTRVERAAFSHIYLQNIDLPDSITYIGEAAFVECWALTSIRIPPNVKEIEERTFGGCRWLKKVILPEGLTTIKKSAFWGCGNLTDINLHDNITYIGKSAFSLCSSLRNIEIPAHLNELEDLAFDACDIVSVKIPDGVRVIGNSVFSSSSLKSVIIPNNVNSIGKGAFQSCENLESVILSPAITKISDATFSNCPKLVKMTLPEGITRIGSYAFDRCLNLSEVNIPKNVTEIGEHAFPENDNLIISVADGSYGHKYCIENQIPFKITGVSSADKDFSIVLDQPDSISLNIGEKLQLNATAIPAGSIVGNLKWTSSASKVVSVDENGFICALKEGTAAITVKSDSGKKDTVKVKVIDQYKPVGIEIDPVPPGIFAGRASMNVGETLQLHVTLKPSTAQTVLEWKSFKEDIVTVDNNGLVTAINGGYVIVQVKTHNDLETSIFIYVSDPHQPKEVVLDQSGTVKLNIGSSLKLNATVLPETSQSKLQWTTSNKKIAVVNEEGIVTPLKEGTTTITVTTRNDKKDTVVVKVVDAYKPSKVMLDQSGTVVLNMGNVLQLHALLQPETAQSKLQWITSSKKVAVVNENGIVKPMKEGTATITVKTHNGKKDTVKVKIIDPYKPSKVVLDQSGTVTLNMGETLQLNAALQPETAQTTLKWSTSSKKIATVDENGVVTPVKEGTVTITVKTANGKKDTVKVKIVDLYKPTGVVLDQSKTVTLKVGETIQLNAELAPETAQTTLKWSTSSKKVAIVEDGLVTAVKKGNATITVKTTNGKKDTVKIKVVPAE